METHLIAWNPPESVDHAPHGQFPYLDSNNHDMYCI